MRWGFGGAGIEPARKNRKKPRRLKAEFESTGFNVEVVGHDNVQGPLLRNDS
jgi:hypothetical protein